MSIPRRFFYLVSFLSVFHTAFGGYNVPDALDYFTAALISTSPPDAVLAWNCVRCPELIGYRHFHMQTLTASNDETFTLTMLYNPDLKKFITAFPGTATIKQLLLEHIGLDSVSYTLSTISGAKATNYFYTRYVNIIRNTFLAKIQEAYKLYPDYQFAFTGHSLGAAITTLAAFDAVTLGYIPSSKTVVYNFGSPRVGNQQLAQAIEKAIPEFYRVVHSRDPVPHIPLCMKNLAGNCMTGVNPLQAIAGVWQAWHIGQEIFYNADNTNYVVCSKKEDPKCGMQYKMKDTTWADHFFYLNRDLPVDGGLINTLDVLTKLRYPSL